MSTEALWWLTLGLGLVVALVAVVLLQLFYNQVRRVEAGSEAIWEAGKQVARNTATTWMLHQTTVRLDALTAEALEHNAFLEIVGGAGGADGSGGAGGAAGSSGSPGEGDGS
ncbi:MAG: hypothetical protein OER95_06575 [Acidimicrobiia bacterium]|nr:hypothetical protein [Acidimicrobiia bacterium]